MTQTHNRLLDEFARLATDAAAVAQGVRREAETAVRAQAERLLSEMNVVHRDEFEAVKETALRTAEENRTLRLEVEDLAGRLARIEADLRSDQVG
jgi:BMFP domain-containing protein YqiC